MRQLPRLLFKYLLILVAFFIVFNVQKLIYYSKSKQLSDKLANLQGDVDRVEVKNQTTIEANLPAGLENQILVAPDDGITSEAKEFLKLLGLKNAGENGYPVELPTNLSDVIQKRVKLGYDTHGYNAFASSMVSLNRKIPDIRSDVCKNKVYENLPKCSIVIPFHDEEWMLLMRTVHSILNRSPLDLIEEILLVDDASTRGCQI